MNCLIRKPLFGTFLLSFRVQKTSGSSESLVGKCNLGQPSLPNEKQQGSKKTKAKLGNADADDYW